MCMLYTLIPNPVLLLLLLCLFIYFFKSFHAVGWLYYKIRRGATLGNGIPLTFPISVLPRLLPQGWKREINKWTSQIYIYNAVWGRYTRKKWLCVYILCIGKLQHWFPNRKWKKQQKKSGRKEVKKKKRRFLSWQKREKEMIDHDE